MNPIQPHQQGDPYSFDNIMKRVWDRYYSTAVVLLSPFTELAKINQQFINAIAPPSNPPPPFQFPLPIPQPIYHTPPPVQNPIVSQLLPPQQPTTPLTTQPSPQPSPSTPPPSLPPQSPPKLTTHEKHLLERKLARKERLERQEARRKQEEAKRAAKEKWIVENQISERMAEIDDMTKEIQEKEYEGIFALQLILEKDDLQQELDEILFTADPHFLSSEQTQRVQNLRTRRAEADAFQAESSSSISLVPYTPTTEKTTKSDTDEEVVVIPQETSSGTDSFVVVEKSLFLKDKPSIDVPYDSNSLFSAVAVGLKKKYGADNEVQNRLSWEADFNILIEDILYIPVNAWIFEEPCATLRAQAATYLKDHLDNPIIQQALLADMANADQEIEHFLGKIDAAFNTLKEKRLAAEKKLISIEVEEKDQKEEKELIEKINKIKAKIVPPKEVNPNELEEKEGDKSKIKKGIYKGKKTPEQILSELLDKYEDHLQNIRYKHYWAFQEWNALEIPLEMATNRYIAKNLIAKYRETTNTTEEGRRAHQQAYIDLCKTDTFFCESAPLVALSFLYNVPIIIKSELNGQIIEQSINPSNSDRAAIILGKFDNNHFKYLKD